MSRTGNQRAYQHASDYNIAKWTTLASYQRQIQLFVFDGTDRATSTGPASVRPSIEDWPYLFAAAAAAAADAAAANGRRTVVARHLSSLAARRSRLWRTWLQDADAGPTSSWVAFVDVNLSEFSRRQSHNTTGQLQPFFRCICSRFTGCHVCVTN